MQNEVGVTRINSDTQLNISVNGTIVANVMANGNIVSNNRVVTRKYSALIRNGAATSFTVTYATHACANDQTNLVRVNDATTGALITPTTTTFASNGDVTVTFGSAPATNAYRIVIIG